MPTDDGARDVRLTMHTLERALAAATEGVTIGVLGDAHVFDVLCEMVQKSGGRIVPAERAVWPVGGGTVRVVAHPKEWRGQRGSLYADYCYWTERLWSLPHT